MRLLCTALLVFSLALPALAAQIVPVNVDTPGGFGPGRLPPPKCMVVEEQSNGQVIECDFSVPVGTTDIAGWGGYTLDLQPFLHPLWSWFAGPLGYVSIELWHNGGTPHKLTMPHWGAGIFPLQDTFYPAGDGHRTQVGDRVFARFRCTGFSWLTSPWCAAGATVHFRVRE